MDNDFQGGAVCQLQGSDFQKLPQPISAGVPSSAVILRRGVRGSLGDRSQLNQDSTAYKIRGHNGLFPPSIL